MKLISQALIVVLSHLTLTSIALPRVFSGEPTTIQLPLADSNRNQKMSLTYWTAYIETSDCMRKSIRCANEDMEAFLFGNITIKNINTRDWFRERGDTLDLRLALNKAGVASNPVYDVV